MSKISTLVQKFIMANPQRAMKFLSSRSSQWWEEKSQAKALATFWEAAKKIPAYKKFLKERNIDPQQIKTFKDFQQKIPLTDKKNYIFPNSLEDLCLERLDKMYTVSMSSGTSGLPCFWPRLRGQDEYVPKFLELLFLQTSELEKKSTLLIIGAALGVYTGGEMINYASKELANSGKYPLTVIPTGSEKESIIQVLKNLAPYYQQIILGTYPNFLGEVVDQAEKEGVNFKQLNLRIITGGEGFTKAWEDFMKEKLGFSKEDLTRVITIFGESAGGVLGMSTPFTNLIRNLADKDPKLFQDFFGKAKGRYSLPVLIEFNPLSCFIEEVEKELVITKRGTIPSIRYNLHDTGGIISHQKAVEILNAHHYDPFKLLKEQGIEKEKIWTQPIFYVYGRSDEVLSVDGANIYPETLEEIIYGPKISEIKGFKLFLKADPLTQRQRFGIYVELKPDVVLNENKKNELSKQVHDLILDHLLKINSDFRKSYEDNPASCDPLVKIYGVGEGPFKADSKLTKRRLIEK